MDLTRDTRHIINEAVHLASYRTGVRQLLGNVLELLRLGSFTAAVGEAFGCLLRE
jgi:hypothetical protein